MNRKFAAGNDEQIGGSRALSVVIDTPRGSRNKFKFDAQKGVFTLSKILPEGMVFPYAFGFLPATEGEDGDPLDVLVLVEAPTFPGCVVECRVLGVIEAEQRKGTDKPIRNDRLLAAATASLLYREVKEIDQIQSAILKDIEGFFVNYDRLRDIEFRVLGRSGPAQARQMIFAARNPSERNRTATWRRVRF
jgi:inorganic pyrophosphatase